MVLIESGVAVFIDESQATSIFEFVGMVYVVPWIVPSRAALQDFAALGLPEDFESHEIQQAANGALEWLAHATTNKVYSPASPLQALVVDTTSDAMYYPTFGV